MSTDDIYTDAAALLHAMDYARQSAAQRERHSAAITELLRGCLEVIDALETLEAHCHELELTGEKLRPRSVALIRRKLLQVVSESGVEPIAAVGTALDLDRHEVVQVRADAATEEDTVLEEVRRGYLWRDTLLRRSRVVISSEFEIREAQTGTLEEEASDESSRH